MKLFDCTYLNSAGGKKILEIMNKSDDLIEFVDDRPGHDERYGIDSSHIRKELGWKPLVDLEDGLERTVRWYLGNEDWWRPILDRQNVSNRLGKKSN